MSYTAFSLNPFTSVGKNSSFGFSVLAFELAKPNVLFMRLVYNLKKACSKFNNFFQFFACG